MRMPLFALAVVALASAAGSSPSAAQTAITYPWCLFSGGSDSSFESCAFNTWEQCQASREGGGGICYVNPAYRPASEPTRSRHHGRRAS